MFWTRLLSGAVLIIIAAVSFFGGTPVLPLVLFFISVVGYRELIKALGVTTEEEGKRGFSAPEIVGYVGITVYYLLVLAVDFCLLENETLYFLACIIGVFLAELFVYVLTFPKYHAEQIAFSVFAFLYAPVMLSFIHFTRMLENGVYLVWLVLICSWGCDTCAYCVGKLIGKKKIFPVLSPKKSLEGCVGGVIGTAVIGVVYGWIVMAHSAGNLCMIALICALGAVISMVGDLAASAIKRNKGIKDYGKLIPGHGGIMDRFDSVIVTAPLVYFLSVILFQ